VWPQYLIVISAIGLLVGFVGYFRLNIDPKVVDSGAVSATNKPVSGIPMVRLSFVNRASPRIIIENDSDVLAEQIKWSIGIWNIDDARAFFNHDTTEQPVVHDALPIPVQTFDFLRAHTQSGQMSIFDTLRASGYVKDGQRLYGSISVISPTCLRGRTYIVGIKYGVSGWYYEDPSLTEGQLVTPKTGKKEDVQDWYRFLENAVPNASRISIP
jgi:hypothetical protein